MLNAKQMHNGLKRICSFNQANNLPLPAQAEIASAVPSPVRVPPCGGTPSLRPRPAGSVSKAREDFVATANKAAFPGAAMSDNGGNGWTRLNAGFVFVFAEYVLIANAITRRPPNLFQKLLERRFRACRIPSNTARRPILQALRQSFTCLIAEGQRNDRRGNEMRGLFGRTGCEKGRMIGGIFLTPPRLEFRVHAALVG